MFLCLAELPELHKWRDNNSNATWGHFARKTLALASGAPNCLFVLFFELDVHFALPCSCESDFREDLNVALDAKDCFYLRSQRCAVVLNHMDGARVGGLPIRRDRWWVMLELAPGDASRKKYSALHAARGIWQSGTWHLALDLWQSFPRSLRKPGLPPFSSISLSGWLHLRSKSLDRV